MKEREKWNEEGEREGEGERERERERESSVDLILTSHYTATLSQLVVERVRRRRPTLAERHYLRPSTRSVN